MSQYSFGYKIIILGKTSVGKSSILNRFIKGTFSEISITTINDFYLDKEIEVRGTPMKLEIWDTAGKEKFRSLVRNYYNGSKAAILVYDITDRDSFNEVVNYWYNEVKTNMQNISKYFFIEKY